MKEPLADNDLVRFNPVPSILTLCNAFCGFASIVTALTCHVRGEALPPLSIWLLIGSMVFDTLDGLAARLLNARSPLGAQLDSLSDSLSFGAAPAAILLTAAARCAAGIPHATVWIWSCCLFYLGCTLWRLGRYNVLSATVRKDDGCFTGLPSPAAACTVYSAALFLPRVTIDPHLLFYSLLAYGLVGGLLMVSAVPYPHARRCVSGEPRFLSIVFIGVVVASICIFRITALMIWTCIYLLIAPLTELFRRQTLRLIPGLLFAPLRRTAAGETDDDEE